MISRDGPPPQGGRSKAPACVVAIDIGGSRVRAAVVDARGRPLAQAAASWSPVTPPELAPAGKEIDAEGLWRLTARLIQRAMREAGVRSRRIAAVAVTSQRQGIAVLDARGREIYAGPNSDARAFFEGQAIDEQHGEEVYRVTGHTPSLLLAPAKLRWLQANRAERFGRARTVLTLDGWALFKLCGERVCERAAGGEVGLLDIHTGDWATHLADTLGVPRGLLPGLTACGERVGAVTRRAAAATGFAEGTPVVAAGPDTQCALLGMGVTAPGRVGIVAGSTAPVQMALERCVVDGQRRTWSGLHVFPRRWVLESTATEAGTAYAWLAGLLGSGESPEAYRRLGRLAARAEPGAGGVLAYVGPRQADMRDMGMRWGGLLFPVPFVDGPVDRGRLARAALENLAFAVRANVAQLEAVAGCKTAGVWLCGGMAQGETLPRILADVLNAPVRRPRWAEASCLGAAMAAAAGAGVHDGLAGAAQAMMRPGRDAEPNALAALDYEEHYRRWLSVGEGLKALGEHL